jgi:type VI secretion system secreted protein Hcp
MYDMFIKITDVKGEAQDAKHKDEIDVLSWSWGVTNSGSTHQGGGSGAGKANVQDLTFTKSVDKASTILQKAACSGKHFPEANMVVRKAGEKPLEYLKVDMKDVIVTSYSTGGSGGSDRITETCKLNFGHVKVTYTPQKPDGSGDAALEYTYNIKTNEVG